MFLHSFYYFYCINIIAFLVTDPMMMIEHVLGSFFIKYLLPYLAFKCAGQPDGTLGAVKPGKCHNKFGKCAYGTIFVCECPDKLFYNEEKEQCDYKTEIVLCGGKPSVPKFDCSGFDNGLYTVESCSSQFFFSCNGGKANQMICSAGLLFDQTKKMCEFPDRCEKKDKTTFGTIYSTTLPAVDP